MKRSFFGFVVLAAMAGAALSEGDADNGEETLQGEWLLISIEVKGQKLPAPIGKGGSILFDKGGKLVLRDPGKPDRIGKYKIDAGNVPKQIDLTGFKDSKAMVGIYELDGEKLKMALSTDGPQGKRPSEFKGDNVLIVHWKRQKP